MGFNFGFDFGFNSRQPVAAGLGPIPDLPITFNGDYDADNGITATGADITNWANSGSVAGASSLLVNDGGASRPTLITADANFNGHNSVAFDGSGNYLYENGHSLAEAMMNVDSKHCFLVLMVGSYVASRTVFNDGNNVFRLGNDSGPDGLSATNNDGGADTTPNIAVPAVNTPALVELLHDGVNLSLKIDNGDYKTVASGNTVAMGTYFEVGHVSGASLWTGRIARMLFDDAILTGQDLLDVRENLGRTYGVTYI